MANKIVLKKSSVAAKVPVAGDLDFGELAINYTDGKLYFKKADNTIDAFTTAAASAPVTSVGGNIGDITDAQLLASIKNVDGTGSGLDADTLDGNHASAFYLASNPNGYTSNTGTVTSVGATAPLVSSGGTAPSISIPAANSTTNGYMSSAYASKLDGIAAGATANTGTVTSVSGTGSYGGLTLSGTVTSSGSLTLGGTPTGTWPISVSGNSSTASTLQTARNINGISFNGSANIDTTEWFHSDRDFPNGTLITTNINYAVSYGDPFVLEIRGNSYGNIVPLDLLYQGCIYSDTIINHGGISNGLTISGLVAINNGGNLCFWFPNQGYWNGYNVKVYTAYATRAVNRVTSITGVAKPTTAKEVALSANIRQSLHSGNYTSYSPSLTGSGASGTWGINITGNADTVDGYHASGLWRSDGGAWNPGANITLNQSGNGQEWSFDITRNGYTGGYWHVWDSSHGTMLGVDATNNYVYATGSSRAPIFYDYNDTGYYIDPNSTSRMVQVNFNNLYYAPDTSYGFIGSSIYVDTINSGYASDQLEINYVRGTWAGISHDSLRAPLYYDYNDTGYYVDPNSNSRLNGRLTVNGGHGDSSLRVALNAAENGAATGEVALQMWCSEPGITWDWAGFGYNVDNNNGSPSGFGRPNTSFGQAYMRMGTGGQWYFYTTNTSGTRYTNMYLAPDNGVETFGILRNDSSVRSPIYYDSNDTGYYLDPNDTSRLNYLRPNRISIVGNQDNGYPRWDFKAYVVESQHHYAQSSTQSMFIGEDNYIYMRTHTEASGSHRAPIFYDSNNTGYYADLNNTTYLYYLQSATTVRADSDRRLKENITPITSALSLVRQLQGCRYTRNDLADKTKVYIGMIAQDVLPIVPEVVSGSEAGKYSLGYAELVPVLNEAIKELDEIVTKQAIVIAKLEERLGKLLND